MQLRVEPSPAGGYVVRAEGADAPVSRHDTEEDAHEWIARHAGGARDTRPDAPARAGLPRFAALPDGTQVLLRTPRRDDPQPTRDADAIAEIPAVGAVAGALVRGAVWTAPGWEGGELEALLRGIADSAPRD